jgi:predicted GH43/DUF377 family glycosyl hydrolase
MLQTYLYDSFQGSMYAQDYALYKEVPVIQRLFYYGDSDDCTNFISQCVWASYGGWVSGIDAPTVGINTKRIKTDIRQVKGEWFGSESNIGSNKWCRVEEFFKYVTDKSKGIGPTAQLVSEGTFWSVDPRIIKQGDVIQMVVTTYTKDRYGHGLFVTKAGSTWDEVLICCHTYDRMNVPMIWFAQYPQIYQKLRILRFLPSKFVS